METMDEDFSSEDEEGNDELRKEMEIALYSQIHFQDNPLYTPQNINNTGDEFRMCVVGNSNEGFKAQSKTSDILLNRSIDLADNEAITTDDVDEDVKPIDLVNLNDSDLDSLCCLLDDDQVDDLPGLQLNVKRNIRALLEEPDSDQDEDEKWKINVDDRRQYKEGFRYHKSYRCHNCNEVGHLSKNCPKPKKETICGFCSEAGHYMMKCPSSLCYNCNEMGHDAKNCPRPRRSIHRECHRCSMIGHNKSDCSDLWRQYHHTISPGKLIQGGRKRSLVTYCYNCAGDDHFGHECYEDRMGRHVRVTIPFVCHYDDRPFSYSISRDGPDETDEPPRKRQKINTCQNSPRKVSKFLINTNQYSNNTGRNNFDKLISKKAKGINKKNKKKLCEETRMKETFNKGKNKKFKNNFVDEEDFPRNFNHTANENGFRSRFGGRNSGKFNKTFSRTYEDRQSVSNSNNTWKSDKKLSNKKKAKKKKKNKNNINQLN